MTHTTFALLLSVAFIGFAPAAFAASDAGSPKPQPAHGYMATSRAVENFKTTHEIAYENNTQNYAERKVEVDGSAYGDQVNLLPAKERLYVYKRGYAQPSVTYRRR